MGGTLLEALWGGPCSLLAAPLRRRQKGPRTGWIVLLLRSLAEQSQSRCGA